MQAGSRAAFRDWCHTRRGRVCEAAAVVYAGMAARGVEEPSVLLRAVLAARRAAEERSGGATAEEVRRVYLTGAWRRSLHACGVTRHASGLSVPQLLRGPSMSWLYMMLRHSSCVAERQSLRVMCGSLCTEHFAGRQG